MDGQGLAAVIGAVAGGAVTMTVNFLAHRRKGKRLDSDLMQDNYQILYLEMRKEISRIQSEQADERRQWAEERKELYKKLDNQSNLIHAKDIEIVELKAKVSVMEFQLKSYEDRNAVSASKVTIKT